MRVYKRSDLIETPWKNGGGITRNIAALMDGEATVWRLSMADVSTAGPFSSFAGLTRVLTVIEGSGMILHGPDASLRADFAQPVTFDGASAIVAELTEGPLRDFNLMFDPERCDGDASSHHGPVQNGVLGSVNDTAILHCITGHMDVNEQRLASGDTAIVENAPLQYSLPDGAIGLAITLGRRDQTDASSPAIA